MATAQLYSFDLTICTVSFESSDWLRLNLDLTTRLNPGRDDLCWIIAENSPANSPARLPPTAAGFRVIPGAPYREMPYASASYHHAAGMNIAVREVTTRYLLVLDPDFYIVRKHWIDNVTRYMHENHIAILGAPWHPGRVSKIRYFPCAHCTFFDLQQIDRDDLDFTPCYEDRQEWVATKKSNLSLGQKLMARLTGAKRRRIGTSHDTGWRIYRRYGSDPRVKSECLQPVFNPRLGRRMVDTFYPDRLRYTPARPGYFRRSGFEHFGLSGLRTNGWEEFFWQGKPFGFHVRCFPLREKATASLQEHYKRAESLLAIY